MNDGDSDIAASLARRYSRGELGTQHQDIHPHTVLVSDDDVRELLSHFAQLFDPTAYNGTPSTFWETKFAKRVLKKEGTEVANYAIKTNQTEVIDFITGLPDFNSDISGIRTIEKLRDWVTRTAAINLLSGHMGSGKSDFALLLAELWQWEMEREGHKHAILSNIQSFEEAETVTSMSKLKERIEEDENERIHVVWDEASSHASGYGTDRDDVEKQLRRFLRMIRKNNGTLTMIGHAEAGKDIHPDVRRLCEAVYKESKKKATVYREIKENREYGAEKMSLDGIPPTSFTFDTSEESDWEWDLEVEEDEDEDEEEEDVMIERCIATNKKGERCGNTNDILGVDQETGECQSHKGSIQSRDDLGVSVDELPRDVIDNLPFNVDLDGEDSRAHARVLGEGEGGEGDGDNEDEDEDDEDDSGDPTDTNDTTSNLSTGRFRPSEH